MHADDFSNICLPRFWRVYKRRESQVLRLLLKAPSTLQAHTLTHIMRSSAIISILISACLPIFAASTDSVDGSPSLILGLLSSSTINSTVPLARRQFIGCTNFDWVICSNAYGCCPDRYTCQPNNPEGAALGRAWCCPPQGLVCGNGEGCCNPETAKCCGTTCCNENMVCTKDLKCVAATSSGLSSSATSTRSVNVTFTSTTTRPWECSDQFYPAMDWLQMRPFLRRITKRSQSQQALFQGPW
ncbi:hypothetical protein DFP72DRAFT_528474 [Ephemerocybe angulata]|uniref:Granulin n=1 Tax=Ephemerocybe angulata TaxID=980116 RepID=A0A8H6IF17_9AGAR|nr:hypothetical protein DFP72DRAFT_528474 [Tulosesus angulatus]